MNDPGMLIVYSGPSGVGKGTILRPYLESNPNAILSVSMTTRAPRPGEVDGVDYYFINHEQFEAQIAQNNLLEYAQYGDNYYGTPREAVERLIEQGRDVVLEIEVKGAMQVKQAFPEAVSVFILPPCYEALCDRLTGRGTEPPEVVEKRLNTARQELEMASEYQYIIINDDVALARERLAAVILAEKCQIKHMKQQIEKVCEFA